MVRKPLSGTSQIRSCIPRRHLGMSHSPYLMRDSMCARFHGIVPEHSTQPGRAILIGNCHLHAHAVRFVCVVCIEQGPVFQASSFLRCYRMAHKQSCGCTHACCNARDLHGQSRLEADASGHVRGIARTHPILPAGNGYDIQHGESRLS